MKIISYISTVLFGYFLLGSLTASAQMQMGSMDSMHSAVTPADSAAATPPLYSAKLTVSVREEDSTNVAAAQLVRVDSAGNTIPLANETVVFYVQRLFGLMPVSEENTAVTDAGGNAESPFPKIFSGDANGVITIVAKIEDNPHTGPMLARASGKWGVALKLDADPFPRALWEPRAPFVMIIAFCVLLGGVWMTYGFILNQLLYIKKGNK